MGDNLAELLYTAWRSSLLSSQPDLPSWGNVRDPDVQAAWERVASVGGRWATARVCDSLEAYVAEFGLERGVACFNERWQR